MNKFFKVFLLVLLGLMLIATVYWLYQQAKPKQIKYEIHTVTEGNIETSTVATGKISPRDEVTIKPQVSGIILEILKKAGDYVNIGDVIAVVKVIPDVSSLSNAESKVRLSEISLNQLQAEYNRQKLLFEKGVIPKNEMEESEASFRKAKEELENSKETLDIIKTGMSRSTAKYSNTQIRSTIMGMILDVPIKVGNSVILSNTFNDGTTIATVANMNDMIFVGDIDETEVDKIHKGMTMKLAVGAVENQKFDATLEYISPKGTEKNGAILFEIKAAAQIPDTVLIRSGYSANAEIVLAKVDKVLTIPESTISFSNDSAYVEVLLDEHNTDIQTFEKRHITIGLSNGLNVEVKSGLMKGEQIRGNEITDKPKTDNK